jgi:hypothetical protein
VRLGSLRNPPNSAMDSLDLANPAIPDILPGSADFGDFPMSDVFAPNQQVTFTITSVPQRIAERKTIRRLMRMQPHIQRGLTKLAKKRRLHDNRTYVRAGKNWTDRVKTTKLTNVKVGETFTLHVTPHIIPDLRSVEKHLEAKAGS